MFKKRAICYRCKAKKYIKYLRVNYPKFPSGVKLYVCVNFSKCHKRGANYKK